MQEDVTRDVSRKGWGILRVVGGPILGFLWSTGLIFPVGLFIVQDLWYFIRPPEFVWSVMWVLCGLKFLGRMRKKRRLKQEKTETANPSAAPGLLTPQPSGVVFGRQGKNFVTRPESADGHVLVVGGSGSGKTSEIAIPTLKSWRSRVFAIDIKGELYEKTRRNREKVKIFAPLDVNSYGYNPFIVLDHSTNPAQDARAIVDAIMPTPQDVKDPFWIENAQNLFVGAILHFHHLGLNFISTIRAIQSVAVDALVAEISQSENEAARYFVNNFLGMEPKTLTTITAELGRNIMVFATDEHLKTALSKGNAITPADLEDGYDIYINIPEHLLGQWKGLLTLMINQFLNYFERRPEMSEQPILFLLDEFPRLGKVEPLVDGLAMLRSKKTTIAVIVQSLAQLDRIYGKSTRQVIVDNCQYKAILNATDADTQEYFSRMVGTHEMEKVSRSKQAGAYVDIRKSRGESVSLEEKRRIKPEEFATLKKIVLFTPYGYTRVERAPYYNE